MIDALKNVAINILNLYHICILFIAYDGLKLRTVYSSY